MCRRSGILLRVWPLTTISPIHPKTVAPLKGTTRMGSIILRVAKILSSNWRHIVTNRVPVVGVGMRGSKERPEGDPNLACAAFNLLAYLGQDFDAVPVTELAALHKIFNSASACVAIPCHQTEDPILWAAYKRWILSRSAAPAVGIVQLLAWFAWFACTEIKRELSHINGGVFLGGNVAVCLLNALVCQSKLGMSDECVRNAVLYKSRTSRST